MTEAPAEVVRGIYDAFARQDGQAAFELIHPDVEVEYRGVVPDASGSYRGHEGIGKLMWTILSSFDVERFEVTPERVVPASDGRVVVGVHQRGFGVTSGVEVETRIGQVWTVRDGRAVRWEIYRDFEEACAAAGVSPAG